MQNQLALHGCKEVGGYEQAQDGDHGPENTPVAASLPLQLEMRVPFEPTAFPSAGRTYLIYELYLGNFTTNSLALRRIEVLDADAVAGRPVAVLEGGEIGPLWQAIGGHPQLAAGQTGVVFLCIAIEGTHVPSKLRHRVLTSDSLAEGAVIGTHGTRLHLLGPPVTGADWIADDSPSNDSHHRLGILIFDGRVLISRRYAIDWEQMKKGATFSGDPRDKRSYYAYGKAVLAVADGRVAATKDGLPDNVPGHDEGFHPAVPLTTDTVFGNTVTLDLGGGQFAHYLHLQSGSLRVKKGDRVRRGQLLARIGGSGDAREPHLHFQVSTSPNALAGEGVPYLIDQYHVKFDGNWHLRKRELPVRDMLIDFDQDGTGVD